jgi:PAS domain S-box-containing protein
MGDRPASPAADLMERLFSTAHRIAAASSADEALQAVLDTVLDCTVRSPADSQSAHVDHVAILRLDERNAGSNKPITTKSWDRHPGSTPLYDAQYTPSETAVDALSKGDLLVIGDVAAMNGNLMLGDPNGVRACVIAPLLARQRLLGVLVIGSQQRHDFTPDEVSFYQRLAGQIAVILGTDTFLDKSEPGAAEGGKEARYRSLVENAGDPIVETDPTGLITGLNAAAETLYGYPAAEIVGQHLSVLVPPSRQPEVEGWLRTVGREQRALHSEGAAVDKHGQTLHIYSTLSPIKNSGGSLVGLAFFSVDFSERSLYQTVLRDERDLLEAILEATNDALMLVDPAQMVVTANLQFEVFFHLPRYQFVNHPVADLIEQVRARSDLPGEFANILLTFAGDNDQSAGGDFEVLVPTLRTVVWYSAPVFAHDGADVGRLFVFRDATREREADRMKTEFVTLVSHELRTPMTSIRGFTDLVLEGDAGPLDVRVQEYLQIIKLNADRLISLINDVLDITRIEAGHVELRRDHYSLVAIIDIIVQTMYPLIEERKQSLVIRLAEDVPQVWVDLERMTQIITNLVENASKYTPGDGEITVEARLVESGDDLPADAPANVLIPAVLISVHDTGIGISTQEQAQLFTRFYRTEAAANRQIEGTGLGLSIVKSFVELHGGQVWFQSQLEQGSSFYFTIPLLGGA